MGILEFLDAHAIAYERYEHEAVLTCEALERVGAGIPGARCKNLFLRDRSGKKHWLLITDHKKQADLKALGAQLGAGRLGFASAERMQRMLGITPGAVSILSLMNDTACEVTLLIDQEIWSEPSFECHPLVNTATLVISRENLERFVALTGHKLEIVDVPCQSG